MGCFSYQNKVKYCILLRKQLIFFTMISGNHLLLGKLNTALSRTPPLGQRWVMVLRLV